MRVRRTIDRLHIRPAGGALAAAILLVACGNKATTPSGGGNSSATVHTASVGSLGSVLVDSKGFTLYHNTQENSGQIVCTGQCASVWPPLLLASGASAPTGSGLSGTLSTITRPDGSVQVTLKGFPLYTYSSDSGPGQSNGQGISGVWFALTPAGSNATSGGRGY
jgi:predicted lipoprotein with Yx(FWY)xxD motif